MFNASAQRTTPGREREMNGAGKAAHLPIDGKAGRKPAPSVMNERSRLVAQASSLQSQGWLRYVRIHRQTGGAPAAKRSNWEANRTRKPGNLGPATRRPWPRSAP